MYVVSYDVSSDKLRNKVAKIMEGFGRRVQYSVFECHLTDRQFEDMYQKLAKILSGTGENGIRIYQICAKCEKKIRTIGVEEKSVLSPEEEALFII